MRINIPNFGVVMKKIVVVLCLLILSGCSAVPSVQLKKEDFEKLNTLSVEASEHDNSMLVVVGKAKMQNGEIKFLSEAKSTLQYV